MKIEKGKFYTFNYYYYGPHLYDSDYDKKFLFILTEGKSEKGRVFSYVSFFYEDEKVYGVDFGKFTVNKDGFNDFGYLDDNLGEIEGEIDLSKEKNDILIKLLNHQQLEIKLRNERIKIINEILN